MVIETEAFVQSQARLPAHVRQLTRRKIALLDSNRSHPSLRVHRMRCVGERGVWTCWIAIQYRLIYRLHDNGTIRLLEVLTHNKFDRKGFTTNV